VSCVAHSDDETFDLSSLTLLGQNSHQASVSPAVTDSAARSATFYINVCWPVAQDGVHCPPNAAVCRKDAANNNTFVVSCLAYWCLAV